MTGNTHSPVHCLIVPGLNNSGPRHWQTRWEQIRDDCVRVDLGAWSNPHRSHWITKLDIAIAQAQGPLVLVAHSLGCLTVAWWAALADQERLSQIAGALLVAPPDVEKADANDILRRFAPAPRVELPFRALLVASGDDPYATIDRSEVFARRWGAQFVNAGLLGHINSDSFLGDWPQGLKLLESLLDAGKQHFQAWRSNALKQGEVGAFNYDASRQYRALPDFLPE